MQRKAKPPEQVMYNNRWVDKSTFRAFVYSDNECKLANSYSEFESLIATGTWFVSKPEPVFKMKRVKNGTDG